VTAASNAFFVFALSNPGGFSMVTPITPTEVQDGAPAPPNAMAIIATQRLQFHEKILRLRASREASGANTAKDQKPRIK
jgi:hypothetical protein